MLRPYDFNYFKSVASVAVPKDISEVLQGDEIHYLVSDILLVQITLNTDTQLKPRIISTSQYLFCASLDFL